MTTPTRAIARIVTGATTLGLATVLATPAAAQSDEMQTDRSGTLPIAVQMYTLREDGALAEQMQAVADAGVSAIETVGTHDVAPEEMTALLDEHGIEVMSTHAGLADLREDLDGVVEFNAAVGNDTITVPYLDEDERPDSVAGWQELGAELAAISSELQASDMRLAYHNHDFEMETYDDRTALEILLAAAGPNVLAEVDLAWVARGGQDPAEYLRRLGDRVFAIHAKDNAPEGENQDEMGFTEVGSGVLDWAAIFDAAEEVGVEWYVIEHDQPADGPASIAESAEFLRTELSARD